MANPFFRFKQFTIHHDKCAMKVGTDGVLLGAWACVNKAQSALDIGTGTGLIAIMLSQRNVSLNVLAIDIDGDAIAQAEANANQSPFRSQIVCNHISLQELTGQKGVKFDLIVSNPPFFAQSLKSPDVQRTTARHTDSLPIDELMEGASKLLIESGRLSLIYPFDQRELLLEMGIKNGLYASRITNVLSTPTSLLPKRVLMEFSKVEATLLVEDSLIIEKERHAYSEEFASLVKDFYLKL